MSDSGNGFLLGFLALLAGAFLAVNVQAGDATKGDPAVFSDIDKDGDACISEEEFKQFHAKMHGNGKGKGYGEAHKYGKGKGQGSGHGQAGKSGQGSGCCDGKGKMPTFSDFDLDGDGSISQSELNQGHAKRMSENAAEGRQMKHAADAPGFSDIDSDGDGKISKGEFAAHQAEHHKEMHKHKDPSEQH